MTVLDVAQTLGPGREVDGDRLLGEGRGGDGGCQDQDGCGQEPADRAIERHVEVSPLGLRCPTVKPVVRGEVYINIYICQYLLHGSVDSVFRFVYTFQAKKVKKTLLLAVFNQFVAL